MNHDLCYPMGRFVGYAKYSPRRMAWIARLVDRETSAAIVTMDCVTPDEAKCWLEAEAKKLNAGQKAK